MNNEVTVLARILKPIGKPVSFKYPGNEGDKKGTSKDRAIVPSNPGDTGVPYWDVIDLIEFPGEAEPEWLRIGYYRKPKDRLVWGSQTTITEPISTWKRVLVQVTLAKPWFRRILEDVHDELNK